MSADTHWQLDRVRQLIRDWMPAAKGAEALGLLDAVERALTPPSVVDRERVKAWADIDLPSSGVNPEPQRVPCEACGGEGSVRVSPISSRLWCHICRGSGVDPEGE